MQEKKKKTQFRMKTNSFHFQYEAIWTRSEDKQKKNTNRKRIQQQHHPHWTTLERKPYVDVFMAIRF